VVPVADCSDTPITAETELEDTTDNAVAVSESDGDAHSHEAHVLDCSQQTWKVHKFLNSSKLVAFFVYLTFALVLPNLKMKYLQYVHASSDYS
jgi:hypothetical protein